jgi:hypothetical protein
VSGAEAQAAAGARRGEGAAEGEIGREPAGEPVLADRQQFGETADLGAALQPQREQTGRMKRSTDSEWASPDFSKG